MAALYSHERKLNYNEALRRLYYWTAQMENRDNDSLIEHYTSKLILIAESIRKNHSENNLYFEK